MTSIIQSIILALRDAGMLCLRRQFLGTVLNYLKVKNNITKLEKTSNMLNCYFCELDVFEDISRIVVIDRSPSQSLGNRFT